MEDLKKCIKKELLIHGAKISNIKMQLYLQLYDFMDSPEIMDKINLKGLNEIIESLHKIEHDLILDSLVLENTERKEKNA